MTREEKINKLTALQTTLDMLVTDGKYLDEEKLNYHIRFLRAALFEVQDVGE